MKSLSDDAVQQYRELGYYAPVPVLTRTEAGELRRKLETFEATGGAMQGLIRHKPHLLFMHFWANDDAARLARGLRAALDQTKVSGPPAAR